MTTLTHGNCVNGTCVACKEERLEQHLSAYPACAGLPLKPAEHAAGFHDSYDVDEVEKVLGQGRFQKLMQFIIERRSSLVSHGHRAWPDNHPEEHKRNAEVHCVRAIDLEAFLAGGN